MHHLPSFHALRLQLIREVENLRSKMYFGDGMWSAGRRLEDSAVVFSGEMELSTICPENVVRFVHPSLSIYPTSRHTFTLHSLSSVEGLLIDPEALPSVGIVGSEEEGLFNRPIIQGHKLVKRSRWARASQGEMLSVGRKMQYWGEGLMKA